MKNCDRVFLLVADDLLRGRLSDLVGSMGVGVSAFRRGRDFFEQLPAAHRGVIVCSQDVPDLEAGELLHQLRTGGVRWPVVVLAECAEEAVASTVAAGAWAVVARDSSSALMWRVILAALVAGCDDLRDRSASDRLQAWLHSQFEKVAGGATAFAPP